MCKKAHLNLADWSQGHTIAQVCLQFRQDVEEEWVAEDLISCYNCRYRRWIPAGIQCLKPIANKA
ncbi:MAG: hypothetical protein ACOH15_04355 [Acetobacterium sp.]